jgi:hypothetical protein
MNIDVNVAVLIGQFILAGFLVWIAFKKAPKERMSLDATTTNQYAQAALAKGTENAALIAHIDMLEARLSIVENKKFKILIEFLAGDPPEVLKSEIVPMLTVDVPLIPPIGIKLAKRRK